MTTGLFLLRCLEVGLNLDDLDGLSVGMVMEIWNEKSMDRLEEEQQDKNGIVYEASQADFDKF